MSNFDMLDILLFEHTIDTYHLNIFEDNFSNKILYYKDA